MSTRSLQRIRSFAPMSVASVVAALATCAATSAAPRGDPNANKNIVILSYGEKYLPAKDLFSLFGAVEVRLGDYPGDPSLAVVTATFAGQTFPLDWCPDEQVFELEGPFSSITELKSILNGTYTITITGASNSVSTFGFNANALTSSMIYSQPRSLSPANGATVSGDEPCTWVKPLRGPATPFFIECARDNLVSDFLPAGTTSWNPGVCMEAGTHSMVVEYVALPTANLITPLTVVSGSITWSNFDFMPAGSPAAGPAVATIGSTFTDFASTGAACPRVGDLDGDGSVGAADLSLLLVAWGSASKTADLNGDGDVGASDLSLLLVNWG